MLYGVVSGLNFLAVASKISPNLPPKFSALEPLNHETYNLLNFLARASKFSASEPLYGKKSKCVIKIVPQEERCKTLQIDKKCIKSR